MGEAVTANADGGGRSAETASGKNASSSTPPAVSWTGTLIAILIGLGLAAVESTNVAEVGGIAALIACAAVAFLVNWAAFVPSWLGKTEKFYDLTGMCTYLLVVGLAVLWSPQRDATTIILAAMIAVWTLRLGSFLFARVIEVGGDARFDTITTSFPALLMTWTLQGLWVFVTAGAALAAMLSTNERSIGPRFWIGLVIWIAGFGIEVVADRQKQAFRRTRSESSPFITNGLWAWSRHPNYFGEMVLWLGIAVIASEALAGRQLVALISPVFVFVLIRYISGVPMLEAKGKKRFGNDPRYRDYVANTPALMLRPPKRSS